MRPVCAVRVNSIANRNLGSARSHILFDGLTSPTLTRWTYSWVLATSVPHWSKTAFEEVSNALAVAEPPTDAEKLTHTRSLMHSFFQAIGATREASFFLLLFTFFVPIPSFSRRNFAPGPPRDNDRQLGRFTTSPVLCLLMRISLSQSRSLPTSNPLQENLGLERQSSVQLKETASIWRPKSTISRGIFSDSAA